MAETTISLERLRKLLDERGVGYRTESFPELTLPFESIQWRADGMLCKFSALLESGLTQLELTRCTPEQAIAATLGDADYERRMDELLCRLTNGKWSKSRSYSVDFMVSCVDEAYEDAALGDDATAFAKRIEQAVAKREPLTLFGVDYEVRGECEVMSTEDTCDFVHKRHTLSCGHVVDAYSEPPNFCPECGGKIRKAVKR